MTGQYDIADRLRVLAKEPKDTRLAQRRTIHETWSRVPNEQRAAVIGDLVSLAKSGELSPDVEATEHAKNGRFPKGAGPAINWLSSVLDYASVKTFHDWHQTLSPEAKAISEAIRCRKPWSGIVDPFFKPMKPYLKNHAAIGTFTRSDPRAATASKSVGIVGDGLTANIAALLIHQATPNVKFRFFEAGENPGGRMSTHETPDGVLFEGGAMRLPKSGKTVHHFLKTLGIGRPGEETIPFPNMGSEVSGKILFKGQVIDWHANASAPEHPELATVVNLFEECSNKLRAPLEEARARHDEHDVRKAWQVYIDKYSGMSVREMLQGEFGFTDEQVSAFSTVGVGTGGLDAYLKNNVSALEFAREITADLTKGQGLLPKGTSDAVRRLGTHRAGSVPPLNEVSRRSYFTPVKKVGIEDGKPVVHYLDNGKKTAREEFDLVLVTAHAGAAKLINLEEALEPNLLRAIAACDMMPSTKLIAQSDNFWTAPDGKVKDGMARVMQSDQEGMNSAYFIPYPSKDGSASEKAAMYLDYRWDDRPVEPDDYFQDALAVIRQISPNMAEQIKLGRSQLYKKDWHAEGGAFRELSSANDKQHLVLSQALAAEQNRALRRPVLYASADSILGGYTETAALEAVRAAGEAIKFFGGDVHEDMPTFEPYAYGAIGEKCDQPTQVTMESGRAGNGIAHELLAEMISARIEQTVSA